MIKKKSFKNLFEKNKSDILNNRINSIIVGKIIYIDKEFVIVYTDLKSESYVSVKEFYNKSGELNINLDDKFTFILENLDNGRGETIISREKAKILETWEKLKYFFKNNITIKGFIKNRVKGGLIIDLNDVEVNINSFLPGSLIGVNSSDKNLIDELEKTELEFKLIKIDKKNNNIILSRKAVLDINNRNERIKIINSLKVNNILLGVVKNITEYGAFLDLGKVDGLLHITDISWKRIKHPSDVLSINDKIKVKILKIDTDKLRIYLGLKQLYNNPWNKTNNKIYLGNKVLGITTNVVKYGCFIDIGNGMEGLIHNSEISWVNKNINPKNYFNINKKIISKIISIDNSFKRISMSIKKCKINPWKIFKEKYKIGDKICVKILFITEYGIFVKIYNYNIDAFIHINNLENIKNNVNLFIKNNVINNKLLTYVYKINYKKERIYLSIYKNFKIYDIKKIIESNKIIYAKIIKNNKNYTFIALNSKFLLKINTLKFKFKTNNKFIKFKIINYDKLNDKLYILIFKNDKNKRKNI
ncbi:S1 RNA-binding domain-containing protein [Candidatus Nardonella dryophthoridicola]|uniref:S1 RNA-binding domain-containing protein n=1 Tax=Candidatus Nardonella dryophthoridicola TaxID=1971485 RepID=UPI001AD8776A|nr:S1 RNA-binding domain-containing protein [Candidatus Nardonella dryophthoridicola]QTJ62917.1 S1 RNA-binding domain-containing protein [Candidatus Nardonella dryophthoridicola]